MPELLAFQSKCRLDYPDHSVELRPYFWNKVKRLVRPIDLGCLSLSGGARLVFKNVDC